MLWKKEKITIPPINGRKWVTSVETIEGMAVMRIDVVILSGGLGQRIRSVFRGPKGLVPVRGKPIVAHVIDWCLAARPRQIIVAAGYQGKLIQLEISRRYGNRPVGVYVEALPGGTAGCVIPLLGQLDDPFLVVNGDALIEGDLHSMWRDHQQSRVLGTVGVCHTPQADVGRLFVPEGPPGAVAEFQEKGICHYPWASAGVYVFAHQAFRNVKQLPASLESDVLPDLVGIKQLRAFPMKRMHDVGTPQRLKEAERWWSEMIQ